MVGENKTDVSCGGSVDEKIGNSAAKINTERVAGQTVRLGHRLRYPLVLLLGAAGYPLAELCWRGRTHWSMALLGGLCLCGILYVSECTCGVLDLFSRALLCCVMISEAEFIFGVIFNLSAGLGIWDYTEKPLNLLGQICAEYSLLWLSLSLPVLALFDACRERAEHRTGRKF